MSEYTKGPWEFDGEYVWAQSIRGYVASPATDDMTSGRCVPKNIAADTIEANGYLIAAAPELLEALVSMLEVHGVTQVYADKHIEIPQSWVEVSDKARAAIAKAKGETK